VLGVAIEHGALEPHFAGHDRDGDVARIELVIIAQAIADVLADALVRSDIALGTLAGLPKRELSCIPQPRLPGRASRFPSSVSARQRTG
jgi:hypothetical protein